MENFEVSCFNAKERNKAKVSLNKNGIIQFKPRKNSNSFKKFYSELLYQTSEKLTNCT